jgi:very-short-patch-repair endonuclease
VNKLNRSLLEHGTKTKERFSREVNLTHMRHYGYPLFTETDYQVPVDRCILDAQYKDENKLDGPLHFTLKGIEYDRKRDDYIKSQGYRVFRFPYFLMYESEWRSCVGDMVVYLIKLERVAKRITNA